MADTTAPIQKAEPAPAAKVEPTPAPVADAKTEPVAAKPIGTVLTEVPAKTEPEVKTEPVAAPPIKTDEKPTDKPEPIPEPVKAPTYALVLPEGSPLGQEDIDRVTKIAKEKGFSPDDAQALLEVENEAVTSFDTKRKAEAAEVSKTWKAETEKDKEIGGEKYRENVELAHRVIARYGTEAFKKILDDTGTGNHAEVVRIFARIGKAMSDDQLIIGTGGASPKQKSTADMLYPTTAK